MPIKIVRSSSSPTAPIMISTKLEKHRGRLAMSVRLDIRTALMTQIPGNSPFFYTSDCGVGFSRILSQMYQRTFEEPAFAVRENCFQIPQ